MPEVPWWLPGLLLALAVLVWLAVWALAARAHARRAADAAYLDEAVPDIRSAGRTLTGEHLDAMWLARQRRSVYRGYDS